MEYSTNITDLSSVPFQDERTRATDIVDDVEGKKSPSKATTPAQQPISPNSLPDALLSNWNRIAQANMSVRMYRDLVRLAMQPSGWRGPGSRGLRAGSLKSFLEFWMAVRDSAVEPELTLAPDGSLAAEWFKSPRQRLDTRFLDHIAIFGLLMNNNVLEGAETRDTVASILKAHQAKPLTWSAR
jgi:hypothetical protein